MKIENYKKLGEKINGQNFNQSYNTTNDDCLSYFGHITSILGLFYVV
jgi:hypothetical protein